MIFTLKITELFRVRVDRGQSSHISFQDCCISSIQYLEKVWYAKVLSEPLVTIEQYRISLNRNTMVINYHFIREGHTTLNCMKSDIQTQLNKNISLL